MSELLARARETADAIRKKVKVQPDVAIILGTGLGELARHVESPTIVPYKALRHMPEPTVASHHGRFLFGRLSGKDAVVMDGRFHRYEGYSLEQVALPVRVFKELGAEILIVSNAAGGMNPNYKQGDIVIIEDHINLMGDNPLVGVKDERLGSRFPDMSNAYDRKLVALAQKVALKLQVRVQVGVYVAVTGPNLETRAEYRFLRAIGADMVGMSTVPEVIVAAQCGLRVLGLSIVTDMCLPDALKPATLDEIIAVASAAEPNLTKLVLRVVQEL
jgi:purine-nucleoside phosphorylase